MTATVWVRSGPFLSVSWIKSAGYSETKDEETIQNIALKCSLLYVERCLGEFAFDHYHFSRIR